MNATAERRWKASDLDEAAVLQAVERSCEERGFWTNTWEVSAAFPDAPFKVVAAKLSRLLHRKLVTGCDCGCRGDWELTAAGRERAGIATEWRPNPRS